MTENGILTGVAQAVAQHANAPPLRKNQTRVVLGTWLVAAGVYGLHDFIARSNLDPALIVEALVKDPKATLSAFGTPFIVEGIMTLFGCLWFFVGIRNARGPRDIMGAFWSLCFLGGCAYALVYGAYLDNAPTVNWYLKGLYISTLAAAVLEFFLLVRGPGRGASALVTRQIQQTAVTWRIGMRRRF